jgi:hypothetical protein
MQDIAQVNFCLRLQIHQGLSKVIYEALSAKGFFRLGLHFNLV